LRWSRAHTHPGSGGARDGRRTPAYLYANVGRYSDLYGYCGADACRYAADDPNGKAFPYAPYTHPDVPADAYTNRHADAPADANVGAHAHTDLASNDL
jgi:hypothetical protein